MQERLRRDPRRQGQEIRHTRSHGLEWCSLSGGTGLGGRCHLPIAQMRSPVKRLSKSSIAAGHPESSLRAPTRGPPC